MIEFTSYNVLSFRFYLAMFVVGFLSAIKNPSPLDSGMLTTMLAYVSIMGAVDFIHFILDVLKYIDEEEK